MKDTEARKLIDEVGNMLVKEINKDYMRQNERFAMLRESHNRLVKYLGLELKCTPETVAYVKRREKNG